MICHLQPDIDGIHICIRHPPNLVVFRQHLAILKRSWFGMVMNQAYTSRYNTESRARMMYGPTQ